MIGRKNIVRVALAGLVLASGIVATSPASGGDSLKLFLKLLDGKNHCLKV